MKTILSAFILLGIILAMSSPAMTGDKTITYAELNTHKIIGSLGHPLGTVLTIEGVVVPDDYRRMKGDSGATLLKIESVDGKMLSHEVILHLRSSYMEDAPKPGQRFTYIGYETGAFTGIPEKAFKIIPQASTAGFQFEVYFEALRREK